MAGQRMSHPEQSTSRKVTALSDFEYRVWEQTKLSADDFGVLPFEALTLRAQNARLKKATDRQVLDALQMLVKLELLLTFEHQGDTYACAPVWQTWQQVRFPRRTINPPPPADVLTRCDEATRYLFSVHPGGCALPAKKKPKDSVAALKSLQSDNKATENNFSVCGPEVPANANAHANADALRVLPEGGPGETAPPAVRPQRVGVAQRARNLGHQSPLEWDRDHASHALRGELCDWVCLPRTLHAEFMNRVMAAGSSRADAEAYVRAWTLDVKARWAGEIPGEDNFKFWRAEWAAKHQTRRPSSTPAPGAGLDALIAAAGKAVSHG